MVRALVLVAAVLAATPAAADGLYFSEAVGGVHVKDELSEHMERGMRVRLALGYRLSTHWAVEGWVAGDLGGSAHDHDVATDPAPIGRSVGGGSCCAPPPDTHSNISAMASVGVDVKYLHPISNHVELYLRGSLGKGWLSGQHEYAGRGFGLGAGAQVKGKVPLIGFLFWPLFFTGWGPKVTGALFIDAGSDVYRLHRSDRREALDATFHRLTVGWAIGADF